jgi:hypothetical protein
MLRLVTVLSIGATLVSCYERTVGFQSGIDGGSDADTDADTDTDTDADTGTAGCAGWLDTASGLCWDEPPSTFAELDRDAAVDFCDGLDGGPWELPTVDDLRSLLDVGDVPDAGCAGNLPGGDCFVSDPDCLGWSCGDDCEVCENLAGPDEGCYWQAPLSGLCDYYWSRSPIDGDAGKGWRVAFSNGGVYGDPYWELGNVRCVCQ